MTCGGVASLASDLVPGHDVEPPRFHLQVVRSINIDPYPFLRPLEASGAGATVGRGCGLVVGLHG
jgi:hypothetical protein